MSAVLQASPLRLPSGQARPVAPANAAPRARLEDLADRRFSGRVTFQRESHLAELLLCAGQPLAATLIGPERSALAGQEALDELLALPPSDWGCQLEAIEPALLAALAGLGAEPEVCPLQGAAGLRALLRDLAARGENGVLELSAESATEAPRGDRWARALLADGRLLGAYSESAPVLSASLAPLGGLLGQPPPRVHWFPAPADPLTLPPPVEAAEGSAAAIERQLIWIVSRFEGDWGRARERLAPAEALLESLVRLHETLVALAEALEAHAEDPAALEGILAEPIEVTPRPMAEIDPRLDGVGPARACPALVELVADALQRVVLAFPDRNLTECCRQAAQALQAELRAVFATTATDGGRAR